MQKYGSENKIDVLEVSAKAGTKVNEGFELLATKILAKREKEKKRTTQPITVTGGNKQSMGCCKN